MFFEKISKTNYQRGEYWLFLTSPSILRGGGEAMAPWHPPPKCATGAEALRIRIMVFELIQCIEYYRECAISLCPTSKFIFSPCPMARDYILYRSIPVKLYSSRESVPLVLLPSVSSPPPPDTEVNANFSINKVFKPLFRKGHPLVCLGRKPIRPCYTIDSAWAHTAAVTVQWLENFGHNFIPAQDWPAA